LVATAGQLISWLASSGAQITNRLEPKRFKADVGQRVGLIASTDAAAGEGAGLGEGAEAVPMGQLQGTGDGGQGRVIGQVGGEGRRGAADGGRCRGPGAGARAGDALAVTSPPPRMVQVMC
jgi:hypothetical protein